MNQPDETTELPLSAEAIQRIRHTLVRFSADWRHYLTCRGDEWTRPSLASYLNESLSVDRIELFRELLRCERDFREQLSEIPVAADYEETFPELASVVRNVFSSDEESAEPSMVSTSIEPPKPSAAAKLTSCVPEFAPQKLGRYQVRGLIDSGAFGSVYRAYDADLDRDVAIKVPHRRHIQSAADVQLFLKEAKVLARLEHPQIVPVYDAGATDDGRCFVVSKWVEGTNLATVIKQRRPDHQETVRWVTSIAEALQVAHRQKIVHRDLKPANILLDSSHRPYVADFGLALREEDYGKLEFQGMTPAYASPEQARGESHLVDGRSDIYSLGIVMYELLTGQRPFVAPTTVELLERVKTHPPRPLRQLDPSIPQELERICLKMLAKRPADRYGTAFDLGEDLRQYLASSNEASPLPRARRIFISYRREDSLALVGRLCDRLQLRYGNDAVFLDVVSLRYGRDFRQQIEESLERCDVLLAVIGPAWRGAMDGASDGKSRLDDEQDYVRIEIESALERQIPVIPLLIGATRMPTEQQLPTLIRELAFQHALTLDPGRDFDHHVERLIQAVDMAQRATGRRTVIAKAHESKQGSQPTAKEGQVLTKGLRSFDERDAEFFLQLLPGVTDREGLPASLRFWKTQIESLDEEQTFRVGLIYGPSGCGKSSLVKAGLLPRLSEQVETVYLEATGDQTEQRLLTTLRKRCPRLTENQSLIESLACLRRGQGLPRGLKLLIVLDQFEQWLHAHADDQQHELIEALRQCDGLHVQAILMVRDDFWMPVTRFMRELDVDLLQGYNFAPVDLFPLPHARKVLALFGRANGDLPAGADAITTKQHAFLEAATVDLSQAGKVICVRLALFAEMMKGKPWTPESLRELGGSHGLGVTFLEETFSGNSANPKHRLHQKAARGVLKTLLPTAGTDIKGHRQSREELLAASGYADRPRDFSELMQVLDAELRLITPTDLEGQSLGDSDVSTVSQVSGTMSSARGRYFQLTHDYLVPALREWLTRKQRETRRGRAEQLLAERSSIWNAKPENRSLPSLLEALRIRLLTRRASWTAAQRAMMRRAQRFHGVRLSGLAMVLAVCLLAASFEVEWNKLSRAESLVNAVIVTSGNSLPDAIENLRPVQVHAVPQLIKRLANQASKPLTPTQRLHALCAQASLGQPHVQSIVDLITTVDGNEIDNIVTALHPARDPALDALRIAAQKADAQRNLAGKVRLATVAMYLGHAGLATGMLEPANRPDPVQRTTFIDLFAREPGDVGKLPNVLQELDHAGTISGLCLAVGSLDPKKVDVQTKDAWHNLWSGWYLNHPDSGVHSASGWAMRMCKLKLPDAPVSLLPTKGMSWCHTPQGLVMLQLKSGEYSESGSDNTPIGKRKSVDGFLLSDREITVGQFQTFLDDAQYRQDHPSEVISDWEGVKEETRPTKVHPVVDVSWLDAVKFCNWLSRRENRRPCYQRKDADDQEAWQLLADADGYRLPDEDQWESACRAGTATAFSCGDDDSSLPSYAVYYASRSEEVGSRKCNAWGLFDMHGNVWEWTQTGFNSKGSARVDRGGSWGNGSRECRSAFRDWNEPSRRDDYLGFRVALVPSAQSNPVKASPDISSAD